MPPMVLADEYITTHLMRDNLRLRDTTAMSGIAGPGRTIHPSPPVTSPKRVLVWLNTIVDSAPSASCGRGC